jgi:hypothetical protein
MQSITTHCKLPETFKYKYFSDMHISTSVYAKVMLAERK